MLQLFPQRAVFEPATSFRPCCSASVFIPLSDPIGLCSFSSAVSTSGTAVDFVLELSDTFMDACSAVGSGGERLDEQHCWQARNKTRPEIHVDERAHEV